MGKGHTLRTHIGTDGTAWLAACVSLGALWVLATSWRAESGTARTALRGLLGGLAALGTAYIGYGVLQIAGLDIRWEWITKGTWPALGFAALVGLVEEAAKLAGIALAVPSQGEGARSRDVLRTTAAVAAVFATAEASLALRGASWPVALGRAALGPVAHGVLAAPFAMALAEATRVSRARLGLHLAAALCFAALLHGLGDWSVARPGWGRAGFAAALLVPTLWLYARARPGTGTARSPGNSYPGSLPRRTTSVGVSRPPAGSRDTASAPGGAASSFGSISPTATAPCEKRRKPAGSGAPVPWITHSW